MLEYKDYCDYETCVALKELGFDEKCFAYYDSEDNVGLLYNEEYSSAFYPVQYTDLLEIHNVRADGCIDAPTLWEAQKWLREKKLTIVEVFVDDDSNTPITYNIYKDGECVCHHHGKYWSVKEWSEALSEGIKQSVKILKNN